MIAGDINIFRSLLLEIGVVLEEAKSCCIRAFGWFAGENAGFETSTE